MSFYFTNNYTSPYKTLPFNITITCSSDADSIKSFEIHNHDILEINAVTKGKIRIYNDNNEFILSEGEMVLSNPFVIHEGEWIDTDEYSEYITLTADLKALFAYRRSILDEAYKELTDGDFVFDEFYPAGTEIFNLMKTLCEKYYNKTPANEALSMSIVYSILSELFEHHYTKASSHRQYSYDIDFLKKVTKYLNNNYNKKISTNDISTALFMEVSQFSRVFKKHYGISFSNYLCKYRCIRATELYKTQKNTSDFSLAEIAEKVGFNNYCYFSRSFKKLIGETPAVYFKRQKRGHINEKENA